MIPQIELLSFHQRRLHCLSVPRRRDHVETTQNSHHLEFAAQLTDRLPRNIAPYTDVVLENDLAGRAILAMLWQQREHLRIHLLSPNPAPNHILAFQAGIAAARNAPSIQRVSNDQLESIAA